MLKHLILFAVALHLMAGCSMLPDFVPLKEKTPQQTQHPAVAYANLQGLSEIDALVKVNNRWLATHFENHLREQASMSGDHSFRRINLDFGGQAILMEAALDISDSQENVISTSISGEIRLDYDGRQMKWVPLVNRLEVDSRNFTFDNQSYEDATNELILRLRQSFDEKIAQAMIDNDGNTIPLDVFPLGQISVGASLPNFGDTVAERTQGLRGLFMVAGSAMLLESQTTSLALDMAFIPDVTNCPADVTVSRAGFSQNVESREPVGIARTLDDNAGINYFFSEITGAKKPLTVVHYWFADGLPMVTEELPVGESFRWRTWSGRGSAGADANRWEVLVVEKESGCILHSQTIRTPDLEPGQVTPNETPISFGDLREAFNARTLDFTIPGDKPDIALIEVTRQFFTSVLQTSLTDLRLDVRFEDPPSFPMRYEAALHPPTTQDIHCERRDCPPPPVCEANLVQCKLLRDTRDCSSCKFRNPLNNRCVSEAVDPICEASRRRQNARYDAERTACIADAEMLKRECDELSQQAFRSCEIESGFLGSACEAVKTSLQSLGDDTPLAGLIAQAKANGTLTARFSNFRIGENLGNLTLDIALRPNLRMEGSLEFNPADVTPPLAECIASWSAPFDSRVVSVPTVNNLLNELEYEGDHFKADWSGFGLDTTIHPSPLRAVFTGKPQLLANCKIGLTPGKVERLTIGTDARFFTGTMKLQVLPLPTTIQLAPATMRISEQDYSAMPQLSAEHLRYDIEE